MSETRKELFDEMIDSIDRSYALMLEYDSIPHNYGGRNYLYQSESRVRNPFCSCALAAAAVC